ncbi:SAM-dependent methyltransferase [Mycobacteroides chelonae]|nr:class I SAM-dependent methyltransferase [[Mycobacterium] chelonae subsp. gwanakae]OHU14894.1 SAM-dependent methyltransferase [Mycobacteroides chelonae]
MSRMYQLAYRFGVTPWESPGVQSGFRVHLAEILARSSVPGAGGRLLDIGCGTGDHSIEMATRGWQVTGVDAVEKAIERARVKAQTAGVSARFVSGDVTELPASIGCGYGLVLDVGCFHGLDETARVAYAREVSAVTVTGASLLMFAFSPGRRGPLPRGASAVELEQVFTGWELSTQEIANTEGLPTPIRKMKPYWFHLTRS